MFLSKKTVTPYKQLSANCSYLLHIMINNIQSYCFILFAAVTRFLIPFVVNVVWCSMYLYY